MRVKSPFRIYFLNNNRADGDSVFTEHVPFGQCRLRVVAKLNSPFVVTMIEYLYRVALALRLHVYFEWAEVKRSWTQTPLKPLSILLLAWNMHVSVSMRAVFCSCCSLIFDIEMSRYIYICAEKTSRKRNISQWKKITL